MDVVRDGAEGGALPYGEDTLLLRISWPAAPPRGLQGRMWRMRPLGAGRRVRVDGAGQSSLSLPPLEADATGLSVAGKVAGTLHDGSDDGLGLAQQIQFAPGGPLRLPLPPVFLPGSPENDEFVKSTIEGFGALRNAIGDIFNAEETDDHPKLKDMKELSEGEIRALERGGEHSHDLKAKFGAGRADLFKDKQGNIYVGGKGGVGEPYAINLNIRNFLK